MLRFVFIGLCVLLPACDFFRQGSEENPEDGEDACTPKPDNQKTQRLLSKSTHSQWDHSSRDELPPVSVYLEEGVVSSDQEANLSRYVADHVGNCMIRSLERMGLGVPPPHSGYHVFVQKEMRDLPGARGQYLPSGEMIFLFSEMKAAWENWQPGASGCVDPLIAHEVVHAISWDCVSSGSTTRFLAEGLAEFTGLSDTDLLPDGSKPAYLCKDSTVTKGDVTQVGTREVFSPHEDETYVYGEYGHDQGSYATGYCFWKRIYDRFGEAGFRSAIVAMQGKLASTDQGPLSTNLIESMSTSLDVSPDEFRTLVQSFNIPPDLLENWQFLPFCVG